CDQRSDLAQQALHPAVSLSNPGKLAFGPLAGAALGHQATLQLLGTALEARHARGEVALGPAQRGALGRGGLLGLGELALQAVDPARELGELVLAARPGDGGAGGGALALLALEPRQSSLGLDAKLLLGVLALLDPPQLALALGRVGSLGLEQGGRAAALLLGLLKTGLEARDVTFERLDGRFGRLRAALQGRLAGLGRAARSALGEEVRLAHPAARPGVVALLHHGVKARPRPGRRRRARVVYGPRPWRPVPPPRTTTATGA